ncbi:MAG: 2-oxo acid dehydrogenase subunit E2 [Pirellulales bacterium]|nr:2-oxo acid dehydrogenase subunit E2 [Pirellulales bacterium]
MSSYVFKLPDLGEGVVEGEIVAWHVQVGDLVHEDQSLVDVMTDKATVTIPSVVSGRVIRMHGDVGEMVVVGADLIRFEVDIQGHEMAATDGLTGEQPIRMLHPAHASSSSDGSPAMAVPQISNVAATVGAMADNPSPPSRPLASPAVRRRAREKGVDLALVAGTGRGSRVTDADIENYLRVGGNAHGRTGRIKRTGTTEIHLAGVRRRIAEKMSISKRHIPHFSYTEQVDITELSELRAFLNEHRTSDEPRLTYLPFVMLSLVKAFVKLPEINSLYDEEREVVTRYEAVHLGIATQTDRGLYVPVVRHVEAMDLREAARELRRVTQATRHNTIRREELTGSTFTITNLGQVGGLAATPIINHPEVGILGIHKATDRPVVRNGQIAIRYVVNLSASFDHRVIDGMVGVSLIQRLKDYLEHPALIFLE